MEDLIQEAKVVLANHFAFYFKAQGFHWNVQGPDFSQYHNLLGEIYEEVYGAVDKLAEEIRGMNAFAPAGLARFSELSEISDDQNIPDSLEMLRRLYNDIPIIEANILRAYDLAEKYRSHHYSNFLAERQDAFKKHAWMLKATLKNMV